MAGILHRKSVSRDDLILSFPTDKWFSLNDCDIEMSKDNFITKLSAMPVELLKRMQSKTGRKFWIDKEDVNKLLSNKIIKKGGAKKGTRKPKKAVYKPHKFTVHDIGMNLIMGRPVTKEQMKVIS